jgi:hypothetical protein
MEDSRSDPVRYGRSVATGIVFRPDLGTFASAVFLGLTRERGGAGDEVIRYGSGFGPPQFSSLLAQPRATARLVQICGKSCGCKACDIGVPLWRIGIDGAQLPMGPGQVQELDAYGRWQTVYPYTPLIANEAERYDFMLGRAIRVLEENLHEAGAQWP